MGVDTYGEGVLPAGGGCDPGSGGGMDEPTLDAAL